jgi:hypothetical protein
VRPASAFPLAGLLALRRREEEEAGRAAAEELRRARAAQASAAVRAGDALRGTVPSEVRTAGLLLAERRFHARLGAAAAQARDVAAEACARADAACATHLAARLRRALVDRARERWEATSRAARERALERELDDRTRACQEARRAPCRAGGAGSSGAPGQRSSNRPDPCRHEMFSARGLCSRGGASSPLRNEDTDSTTRS